MSLILRSRIISPKFIVRARRLHKISTPSRNVPVSPQHRLPCSFFLSWMLALALAIWTLCVLPTLARTAVYKGHEFPTSLFSSMYYMPQQPTAEPRPAIPRLGTDEWFPDSLNHPWHEPQRPPPSEAVLPKPIHGLGNKTSALIHDIFNTAYQLFRGDNSSMLCNVCRTGLSTLQTLTHLDPDAVPNVLTGLCRTFDLLGKQAVADQCALTFDRAMYGGPIAQAMSYGNFSGAAPDATLVCSVVGFCDRPSETLSESFLEAWFGGSREPSAQVRERWHAMQARAQRTFDEARLLPVLHLSDIHVDGRYMVGSESNCTFGETRYCCHALSANQDRWTKPITQGRVPPANISVPAGYWGSYTCDAPWSLVGSAMEAIRHVGGGSGYALALFTGDVTVHDDLFRYSQDLVMYSEQSVFDALKHILGEAPLFATLGNHETSPENFYAPHSLPDGRGRQFDWDSEYLARLWLSEGWIDAQGEQDVRTHYGGYSISPRPGLRIVSLNSDVRICLPHHSVLVLCECVQLHPFY